MTNLITKIYCDQCGRTLTVAAEVPRKIAKAAYRGDPDATARLNQARDDYLTAHQMECTAA